MIAVLLLVKTLMVPLRKSARILNRIKPLLLKVRNDYQATLAEWGGNTLENRSASHLVLQAHIYGTANKVTINEGVSGKLTINITGDRNVVSIGKGVIFYEPRITEINIHCSGSRMTLGENTTTQGSSFYLLEPETFIEIGRNCMFAGETGLWCSDFHAVLDGTTMRRTNQAKSITIKDHVWIGWGVKVLKNVTVGENSIIGVHSVVTRSIPPNCVAMGVPAQSVRANVNWNEAR